MASRRLTRRQRAVIQHLQAERRQRAVRRTDILAEAPGKDRLGPEQPGLVIANHGPAAIVEDQQGILYRCAVRQNLVTLVCGDRIVWQASGIGEGVVVAMQDRHSLLARPDYSGRSKVIAANLDQVVVVIAPRPKYNPFLIDRYLVTVSTMEATPLLVVNKIDLLDNNARADMEAGLAAYRRIGYPVLFTSTRTAHGLDSLRSYLQGRTSILVGQSGVGKSSLIKVLLPDRDIRVQALSRATGYGIHTTTLSTLYHLPNGGDLIDSPGMRSFELGQLDQEDLQRGFPEFEPYRGQCRFANCGHTVEPDCALQAAIRRREIDPRRLRSYHQLKTSLTGP